MKLYLILFYLIIFLISFFTLTPQISAEAEKLDFPDIYHSIQPAGGVITFSSSLTVGNVISILLRYLFPILALIFILMIIYGGFKFMTSTGNPKSIQSAKSLLISSFLGFTLIFLSYWITRLIASIFGLGEISSMF